MYSLVIESAAMKEDGNYILTASNNVGETICTANLKVRVIKPEFVKKPDSKVVQDYEDVITKVRVTGMPKPTIQWLKDGEALNMSLIEPNTKSAKYTVATSGDEQVVSELQISHFGPKDAAQVIFQTKFFLN